MDDFDKPIVFTVILLSVWFLGFVSGLFIGLC